MIKNFNVIKALALTGILSISFLYSRSDNLEEAKALIEEGYHEDAVRILEAEKQRGNVASNLYLGRIAFLNYNFDDATNHYNNFRKHKKKISEEETELLEQWEHELELTENALERVEKIVIIDSINVPKDKFLKSYILPSSAGKVLPINDLPFKKTSQGDDTGFLNENGTYAIWTETANDGGKKLMESDYLIDLGWQTPQPLPEEINEGNNIGYPYLSADGSNLYFASDGENSIGGLDIFIAQKDPITGEFLQPLNIGMPYNSPYDDYMLVIDEENGVGWWATDRNLLENEVTIYVYLLNDIRKNYDPEDENLISLARIENFRDSQKDAEKSVINDKINAIKRIDTSDKRSDENFVFPLSSNKIYKSFSDFKNRDAKKLMEEYLAKYQSFQKMEKELYALRKRFSANKSPQLREEIIKLERKVDIERKALHELKNKIYIAEKGR